MSVSFRRDLRELERLSDELGYNTISFLGLIQDKRCEGSLESWDEDELEDLKTYESKITNFTRQLKFKFDEFYHAVKES